MLQAADRYCEICRAPQAAVPCARCVLPSPPPSVKIRHGAQRRPVEPIVLDGKYRLLEELGRGGMGTVFKAFDESLDREVAVKFLLPELQARPAVVKLFRREARAMASISHKNVAKIYSFGRYGSADFMVTELIDGPTLEQVIDATFERKMFVDARDVLDILKQVSAGLAAIHNAGVIHRDIKSGNVMLESSTGRALIMDFGLGQRVDLEAKESMVAPRGTPAVMAPEIIANRNIDPSREYLSDIYAFGVVAFELSTNALPFDGESWIEVLEKHLEEKPPPVFERRQDIPEALGEVISKCLEKDPNLRFQSAEAISNELGAIARNLSVEDPRESKRRLPLWHR